MRPSPTLSDPEQLSAQLRPEVWRYLRYLGAEANEADDLCQEAFTELFNRGQDFEHRHPRATLGWLRRAARHLFLAARQREGRAPDSRELEVADAVWEEGLGGDRQAYLRALQTCLDKLPPRSRLVIRQRYEEGLGRPAIAAALGRSPAAIKTLLRRIREELRRCIHREDP